MSVSNQPTVQDSRTIEPWSMGYATNKLFADDCLTVIKQLPTESIDLIYLDPPFNSDVNYNVFFDVAVNKKDRAQIEAFEDTWFYSEEAEWRMKRFSRRRVKSYSHYYRGLRCNYPQNSHAGLSVLYGRAVSRDASRVEVYW